MWYTRNSLKILINPQLKNAKVKGRGLGNKHWKWAWREHTLTPGHVSLALFPTAAALAHTLTMSFPEWPQIPPNERVFLPPILPHTKTPCMLLRDVLPKVQCRSFHTSESVVQMRDCVSKPSVIGSYFLSSCVTPTNQHTHAYSLNSRILLVLFLPLPRDSQAILSSLQDSSAELLHDNCLPRWKCFYLYIPVCTQKNMPLKEFRKMTNFSNCLVLPKLGFPDYSNPHLQTK